jgi:hypothetical protein
MSMQHLAFGLEFYTNRLKNVKLWLCTILRLDAFTIAKQVGGNLIFSINQGTWDIWNVLLNRWRKKRFGTSTKFVQNMVCTTTGFANQGYTIYDFSSRPNIHMKMSKSACALGQRDCNKGYKVVKCLVAMGLYLFYG